VAYDDTLTAEYSSPRLSSVHIAWKEMTMNGLNYLLNLCYDMQRPVERQFPVGLSWRNTIAKPAKQTKQTKPVQPARTRKAVKQADV